MSNAIRYRSLLTETLPFEVPVIFSNDKLHSSLCVGAKTDECKKAVETARNISGSFSKPYSYRISKGDTQSTTLGIIHPNWQLKICKFYEDHSASLLAHCANDIFTLRRPSELASPLAESIGPDEESRLRLGVAQEAKDAGEPDVSHMMSYFVYRRYTLLGKFIESREQQRLESRFRMQRTLDVSKCFFNMYTHSVTWAIKDKKYAKDYANRYSYEAALDKLMQGCNYNETNGIVVGPEFSRIFAETILQAIDANVALDLSAEGLDRTKDYDVRRYVDDYYLYANGQEELLKVEQAIRRRLEEYKLFVNEAKVATHLRPFVTPLSLAKADAANVMRSLSEIIRRAVETNAPVPIRQVKDALYQLRLVVSRYSVKFEQLSGWIFSRLRRGITDLFRFASETIPPERRRHLVDAAVSMLEVGFYIASIDFRVRSTYSLSQLAMLFRERANLYTAEQKDEIDHVISEGVTEMLRSAKARGQLDPKEAEPIEVFNVMICGILFVGPDLLMQEQFKEAIRSLLKTDRIRYFTYVALKFCLLADKQSSRSSLDGLNALVEQRMNSDDFDAKLNAEDYMLACDYIGAPDVSPSDKRKAFKSAFDMTISKGTALELEAHLGFVDWHGLSVEHLLQRKMLRPVYAWA